MTVKDTVYACLIKYSTLYENKWQVYEHLFSTYGNGYEWIDGELISLEYVKYSKNKNGEDKIIKPTLSKLGIKRSDIPERVKKEAEDFTPVFHTWVGGRLEEDRREFYGGVVFEKLFERAKKMGLPFGTKEEFIESKMKEGPKKLSLLEAEHITEEEYLTRGQSLNYSYVYNYPEDIKKDWTKARQEWEDYLRSKGCWLKED